jgi:broad specificity phosphatase PhoE
MTEVIIARHGQTEWNVGEVFRGRIDIALDETGLKQAELLAEYLSKKMIEAIYSSPLKRAVQTAEAIVHLHNLKVEIAPGLIDFNFGKWQGLPHQEVKEKYRELYAEWDLSPHRVRMLDGESLGDVRKRAIGVVDGVVSKHKGTVVLVAHRVVNKVLICALLGLDNSHFWNIKQDTCGMTTFTYENGQFILTEHNNTSYLQSIQKGTLSDF